MVPVLVLDLLRVKLLVISMVGTRMTHCFQPDVLSVHFFIKDQCCRRWTRCGPWCRCPSVPRCHIFSMCFLKIKAEKKYQAILLKHPV